MADYDFGKVPTAEIMPPPPKDPPPAHLLRKRAAADDVDSPGARKRRATAGGGVRAPGNGDGGDGVDGVGGSAAASEARWLFSASVLPGDFTAALDAINLKDSRNITIVFCYKNCPIPGYTKDRENDDDDEGNEDPGDGKDGIMSAPLVDGTLSHFLDRTDATCLAIMATQPNYACLSTAWVVCEMKLERDDDDDDDNDDDNESSNGPEMRAGYLVISINVSLIKSALKHSGAEPMTLVAGNHRDDLFIQLAPKANGAVVQNTLRTNDTDLPPMPPDVSGADLMKALGQDHGANFGIMSTRFAKGMSLFVMAPTTLVADLGGVGTDRGTLVISLSDVASHQHTAKHVRALVVDAARPPESMDASMVVYGAMPNTGASTINVLGRIQRRSDGDETAAASAAMEEAAEAAQLSPEDGEEESFLRAMPPKPPAKKKGRGQKSIDDGKAMNNAVSAYLRSMYTIGTSKQILPVASPAGPLTVRAGVTVPEQVMHDVLYGAQKKPSVTLCFPELAVDSTLGGLGVVAEMTTNCVAVHLIGEKLVDEDLVRELEGKYQGTRLSFVQRALLQVTKKK